MASVTNRHLVDQDALTALRQPRRDWLVEEATQNDGTFALASGPFRTWTRSLVVSGDASGDSDTSSHSNASNHSDASNDGDTSRHSDTNSRVEVTEHIDFALDLPFWRHLAQPLVAWQLRRPHRTQAPFWAPPERFDARGARAFALLIFASLAGAYLGTLLSQTMTYVAREFDKGEATQGYVLSMTRGGALIALAVVHAADRLGRRRMLLASGAAATLFAVLSAASPTIWVFGASQTVSRGFATAFAILIGVIAAEESPAGSRAWITSVLALFAGLGSGMVLWALPLTSLGERAWRWIFVIAVLIFPLLWGLARQLEETRRFETMQSHTGPRAVISPIMKRRFVMLATVGFALALFAAPASNFQNEYLRTTRGFSATQISLYSLVVSTPVGIGVAIAGPQADRRGRRLVGIIGIVGGITFTVLRYGVSGPLMWVAGTLGTVIGAATIPALGVYGPELFPTSRRGLANGLLTCVSVVGSVIGLILVGQLTERAGWSFGQTFALLAVLPMLAIFVVARYPETAQRALEELNPEDEARAST